MYLYSCKMNQYGRRQNRSKEDIAYLKDVLHAICPETAGNVKHLA